MTDFKPNAEIMNELISSKSLARRKVFTKVYAALYEAALFDNKSDIAPYFGTDDLTRYKELCDSRSERKESKREGPAALITINPPDGTTLETLKTLVEKFVKRKWIECYWYCFETRGYLEPEDGTEEGNEYVGLHSHIFLKRGKHPPAHVQRDVDATFKELFENVPKGSLWHTMNIKYFKEEDVPNGINYVKGWKKGLRKENFTADSLLRSDFALEEYYSSP